MKNLLFPAFTILLLAGSCDKTIVTPASPVNGVTANPDHTYRKWVDFNYTLVKDVNSGEYSCPTPKSDCSKIQPDPVSSFATLDEAISDNAVTAFFNSATWADEFPYLDRQADVVAGLQNGSYTMVRRANSAGEILYIVISSDENPAAFNKAIYTTLVTKE